MVRHWSSAVYWFYCLAARRRAGEKIDNVVENIGKKLEEAGDSISNDGPAEKLGEDIDEAVENAKK